MNKIGENLRWFFKTLFEGLFGSTYKVGDIVAFSRSNIRKGLQQVGEIIEVKHAGYIINLKIFDGNYFVTDNDIKFKYFNMKEMK